MSFLRSCVKLKSNSSNFKFCNWGPITIRHNLFFSLKKHSTLVSTLYCSLYRFFFTLVLYLYVVSAPNITPYWHPLMCVLQYMKPLFKNIQRFLIYLFWNSTCMLIQKQFLYFVIVTFIFILLFTDLHLQYLKYKRNKYLYLEFSQKWSDVIIHFFYIFRKEKTIK